MSTRRIRSGGTTATSIKKKLSEKDVAAFLWGTGKMQATGERTLANIGKKRGQEPERK